MATQINVPSRNEVNITNQEIFDKLNNALGFVPNLYATFAHSNTALGDYLAFQNRKTSLSSKEKEIINLVVSEVNECEYCLAAHTAIAKMNGFDDNQILEIRSGDISFNSKFDALAKFAKETTINRGKTSAALTTLFLKAGYTKENLVDALVVIGDKTISNYLHGVTQIPVDFPKARKLEAVTV